MSHPLLLVPLLLAPSPLTDEGELRLAPLFQDHAVLQRDVDVPVWGKAEPGAAVEVRASWFDGARTVVADAHGHWRVDLPPGPAGGPHSLTAKSGGTTIQRADVLLGEVWLASGQSNMEWSLSLSDGHEDAIATADLPALRFFHVPRRVSFEREWDVPATERRGTWQVARPTNVAEFSAVAHHFGRTLHEELGVPVGLIGSYWGGTPVEAWTSEDALGTRCDYVAELVRLDHLRREPDDAPSLGELQAAWWSTWETRDPGVTGRWAEASSSEDWRPAAVPGTWDGLELGDYDGSLWYRCEVRVPASLIGRDLLLELGSIDDMDVTWFNGRMVGETRTDGRWQTPRRYEVPANLVSEHNVVVVCAVDSGGIGRLGDEGTTPRLRDRESDESVALESWSYRVGAPLSDLGAWPRTPAFGPGDATSLSNAMIDPLTPFALAGVIWYQGEANVSHAARYRTLFPLMIRDWRTRFERPELPFYFVQLAPFSYGGDRGQAAELREAQALALELPNTGMAVTMDIGNPEDIHPREKAEVGRRLALWALAGPYGRKGVTVSGPLLAGCEVEGSRMRLRFAHADGGLVADGEPSCFTIAGPDEVFHPASARIEGETLLVWSDAVSEPRAVRHAWGAADEPTLRNGAGLPAPSFRTDDWPPVSAP